MSDIVWVRPDVVLAVHEEQLAEHGGGAGLRDEGLLHAALARPQNLVAYGDPDPDPDLAELAAAYAYGIARNHPFVDGNKPTAFVVAELFLAMNGLTLEADDAVCVVIMLDLAAGNLSESDLAAWLARHLRPR